MTPEDDRTPTDVAPNGALVSQPESERSLLIVDDDEPLCQRLARAMERRGFIVRTADSGAAGMAIARDDAGITLVNPKNERTTIAANEIEELRESPVSLMPDDLYRQLKPQELRDLFSYLESNGK